MKPLMDCGRTERLSKFGIRPEEITPDMKRLRILNKNPHGLKIEKDGCWYPSYWDNGLLFEPIQVWMKRLTASYPRFRSFVDLGSGDGFPVFIAAANRLNATGIENNLECFNASLKSKKILEKMGLTGITQRCTFIYGDAFDKRTCNFKDIDLFHIYPSVNGMQKAVDLYASEGKDTSLLLVRDNGEIDKVDLSTYYIDQDFFGFFLIAKKAPSEA